MAKTEALEKTTTPGALARPDFIPMGDTRGTEHLTRDDLKMPRLALAQQMSDQLIEGHTDFIAGLKIQDMFNDVSKEIYGRGPLEMMIVRADPPRYIEFIPRNQGGGVKDMEVPPNDPRTRFTKDPQGNSVPPVATKFYDFIVLLLPLSANPLDNLMALSLKSSNIPEAKNLNTLIRRRNAPLYTGKYQVFSTMTTNKKGTFATYRVINSEAPSPESAVMPDGTVVPGWVSKELMAFGEKMFNELKDRKITIEREAGEEDFNPEDM